MSFSKLKAIKFGLEKTKADPFIVVGISLATVIYWSFPFYIVSYLLGVNEALGTLLLFAFLIINFLIMMGYMKVVIDIHDGRSVSLKDLFMHYKKLPDFLIGFLFYLVIISVSSLFLVIPGIYLAVRFSFGLFFVLQGDGPALESLKKSWNLTKGKFFELLIFYLFLLFINILGASVVLLGLAFTLPITGIAIIYSYRKLAYEQKKREIEKIGR